MGLIKQILEDTLKVNDPEKSGTDKYSFTRIALAWSLFAYLTSAVVYLFLSITNPDSTTPAMLTGVLNSLEFPIMIFSGYAFGGKTLKTLEGVLTNRNRNNGTINNTIDNPVASSVLNRETFTTRSTQTQNRTDLSDPLAESPF